MERRIAKRNVYADVQEDGGKVHRLVAVAGQPIPAAFVDLVDEADVTTERARSRVATETVFADVDEGLGTTVHRKVAVAGQPVPAAFDEHVGPSLAEEIEHEPDASPNAIATAAAQPAAGDGDGDDAAAKEAAEREAEEQRAAAEAAEREAADQQAAAEAAAKEAADQQAAAEAAAKEAAEQQAAAEAAAAGAFDAAAASKPELVAHIREQKLTVPDTVALAGGDRALARRVLAAEKQAHGGKPRATAKAQLEAIIKPG